MMTREEALRRFKAAKQTKKDAVAALEQKMKQAYEERTGLEAKYVVTLCGNYSAQRQSRSQCHYLRVHDYDILA